MVGKARSPEYPAIGLKEAVEKVKLIWDKDYQNKVPKQVIAEHMGYKGLNGGSLPIISALSKYGLIEGRGDETRVSDVGLNIVAHQPGDPERLNAIQTAAASPELFAELNQRFPGGKASDSAVRSYLLVQKFIPGAADAAIRAYRETQELVNAESEAYTRANPEAAFQTEMQEREQQALDDGFGPGDRRSRAAPNIVSLGAEHPSQRKEIITLDEGDVVISFPDGLSAESVADLSDHLQLFIRKAQRRAGPVSAEAKKDEAGH